MNAGESKDRDGRSEVDHSTSGSSGFHHLTEEGAKLGLQPQHLKLIQDSAISEYVEAHRGYWTALTKAEIKRLGFSDRPTSAPASVLRVYDVRGELALHLLRPDTPRVTRGTPQKYVTPAGARMVVDVPSICHTDLANPDKPLFMTEGI